MATLISRGILLVLGVVAIVVAAKAWLEWNDEDNTLPIEQIVSAEQLLVLPPPQQEERLLVVRLTRNQFALINPTKFPIHYTGYTIGSWTNRPPRGDVNPFYHAEVRDEKGQWVRGAGARCGTGAGTMTVRPGQAGRFVIHEEFRDKESRIGVTFWRGNPQAPETIWSEPIRQ